MRKRSFPAAVLLFASCFNAQQDIPVQTCPKCQPAGSTGGRTGGNMGGSTGASAGSSSGGSPGTSSSGGTTGASAGGSSSGGSTGGPVDAGPLTGTVCPDGSVVFSGSVEDLCASLAEHGKVFLPGVQVSTIPPWGAAVTASAGGYQICMDPGVPTDLVFTKAGYVDSYSAQLEIQPGSITNPIEGEIAVVCTSEISAYETQVPQFNPALGAVFVLYTPLQSTSPCGGEEDGGPDAGEISDLAGWVIQGLLADGGMPPDGGWPVGYIDYSGQLESTSSTFETGEALIYNIPLDVGYIRVQATKPGVTQQCALLSTGDVGGFTGLSAVLPNAFVFYPYAVF